MGSSAIYLSNVLLKLTASTKLDDQEGLGIKGFKIVAEFIKSRSAEAGRKFDLIFSQSKGYLNTETNYTTLKDNKLIGGASRSFYLNDLPDFKFSQKDFLSKYTVNEEFRNIFEKNVKELYTSFIPVTDIFGDEVVDNELEKIVEEENNAVELVECVDETQNIWLGSDKKYYEAETMTEVEVTFD